MTNLDKNFDKIFGEFNARAYKTFKDHDLNEKEMAKIMRGLVEDMTTYKTFGNRTLSEGSLLIKPERWWGENPSYSIIDIKPTALGKNEEFFVTRGTADTEEVVDSILQSSTDAIWDDNYENPYKNLEDYISDYEMIHDAMKYDINSFFSPLDRSIISYEELIEELNGINIEGVEGLDYSLERPFTEHEQKKERPNKRENRNFIRKREEENKKLNREEEER